MIRVIRGNEPASLAPVREAQLKKLRQIIAQRPITSKDVSGYGVVKSDLWLAQHCKCCYCEKIAEPSFNDVEHFRPKASADRRPGSELKHGYWWLAFTWSNLLFACPNCNRSNKNDSFPLAEKSVVLEPEQSTEGTGELSLLIDPANLNINPVEHMVHVLRGQRWQIEPRNNSLLGETSITVYGLDRSELSELWKSHIKSHVKPQLDELQASLNAGEPNNALHQYKRTLALFSPEMPFAALNYDAARHFIDEAQLKKVINKTWPTPKEVCV